MALLPADGGDLLPMPHGAAKEGGATTRLLEKDRMGNDSWNITMENSGKSPIFLWQNSLFSMVKTYKKNYGKITIF